MATVREGFGLLCSSVLVGVLYGFPVIGAVVAQLLGSGDLVAAVEERRFETRMIDTPMYAPEATTVKIRSRRGPRAREAGEEAGRGADPPPATKATADAAEPVESELVDVAVLGDAERPPRPSAARSAFPTTRDRPGRRRDVADRRRHRRLLREAHQPGPEARVGRWNRGADGKVDGFKVKRMRCGNVLRQAGLENGRRDPVDQREDRALDPDRHLRVHEAAQQERPAASRSRATVRSCTSSTS
jgi:hypothetical protein